MNNLPRDEADRAHRELIRIKNRHTFYCPVCQNGAVCQVLNAYLFAINVTEVLTWKVVDSNDQEA